MVLYKTSATEKSKQESIYLIQTEVTRFVINKNIAQLRTNKTWVGLPTE